MKEPRSYFLGFFFRIFIIKYQKMSTALKNLSETIGKVPSAKNMAFGIVVSEWNIEITSELLKGAYDTLVKYGAGEEDIVVQYVPGSFELPFGAKSLIDEYELDAVICLGCVIQGNTPHFTYVCQGVTEGIMRVSLDTNVPVIFGVLTTNTLEQARDRAGGKYGNKGVEGAVTAIKMAEMSMRVYKY
jgi:6,7-dimethyl-8-ribityllumazine synthase